MRTNDAEKAQSDSKTLFAAVVWKSKFFSQSER